MPDPIQHRYHGSRTAAPSSSRQRDNGTQHRAQSLSYRQLLQQRLQKHGWSATFNPECIGPQHAQQWSGSFWIGDTKIGQSSWHSSKDAAKEEAAQRSMAWFDANYDHATQPTSSHELLQRRLADYRWGSTLITEWTELNDTQQWTATFWIGRIKIGQSDSHNSETDAKEEAAQRAIEWCEIYGHYGRQPSSYQELLQHRVQEYGLTVRFFRSYGDPLNETRCRISYRIGVYGVGESDWRDCEDFAREEAGCSAFSCLARSKWLSLIRYPGK
jgi:dsRNA-specific ribonuclease